MRARISVFAPGMSRSSILTPWSSLGSRTMRLSTCVSGSVRASRIDSHTTPRSVPTLPPSNQRSTVRSSGGRRNSTRSRGGGSCCNRRIASGVRGQGFREVRKVRVMRLGDEQDVAEVPDHAALRNSAEKEQTEPAPRIGGRAPSCFCCCCCWQAQPWHWRCGNRMACAGAIPAWLRGVPPRGHRRIGQDILVHAGPARPDRTSGRSATAIVGRIRCWPRNCWASSTCSLKAGSTPTCSRSTCAAAIPGAC